MSPSIRKLTGRIGALVEGVDFAAPPDLSTITTLRHALNEHKTIVFDNVNPDNAAQERVAFPRLNRVTVAGEMPVGVDGRRSEPLVGDALHYSSVLAVAA